MTNSKLNVEDGTMTVDLARLSPDALGEILRTHVYGEGNGYRNVDVTGPYAPIPQEMLSEALVDEMLGDPDCRDEWMKVTAWSDGNLLIAYACDGDTSLLFQVNLPGGKRTVVNHDAKHQGGWTEVEGLQS